MVIFNIDQIFTLLVDNILSKTSEEFLIHCEKLGMTKIESIPDVGQYSQLQPFDSRYCFEFTSPRSVSARFEILVISNKILQAGVNLYYKKGMITSPAYKIFEHAKNLLDNRFGLGIQMGSENEPIFNYGDNKLLGYVSLIKSDKMGVNLKTINVNLKIGNAEIFNKHHPFK